MAHVKAGCFCVGVMLSPKTVSNFCEVTMAKYTAAAKPRKGITTFHLGCAGDAVRTSAEDIWLTLGVAHETKEMSWAMPKVQCQSGGGCGRRDRGG